MGITNLNYFGDESIQLYRVCYRRTLNEDDRYAYFLGTSLEDVVDMFPALFWTGKSDPEEIRPCTDAKEISIAKQEIRSIERVSQTVLARY